MTWATPEEVRAYSDYAAVDAKTDGELEILITKAERFIVLFTCQDFEDAEADVLLDLKILVCALVELFVLGAGNAAVLAVALQAERIGDYSYTKGVWNEKAPTGDIYIDTLLLRYRVCGHTTSVVTLLTGGPTSAAEG